MSQFDNSKEMMRVLNTIRTREYYFFAQRVNLGKNVMDMVDTRVTIRDVLNEQSVTRTLPIASSSGKCGNNFRARTI